MTVKSVLLNLAKTMTCFWLMNHDNTSAVIARVKGPIIQLSLVPPAPTYMPLRFKTRLHSENEWFPTQSRMTS